VSYIAEGVVRGLIAMGIMVGTLAFIGGFVIGAATILIIKS